MKNIVQSAVFLVLFSGSCHVLALTSSVAAEDMGYRAVVQIAIPAYDSDGDVTGYCNGTLISKNTLVTAAHCVVSSHLFQGQPIKIEVGQYRYRETPNGIIRTGYATTLRHSTPVTVQLRPGVSPTSPPNRISPENDYAILKLQNEIPVPADFIFPTVWNQNLTTSMQSQAFVVTINPVAYISTSDWPA